MKQANVGFDARGDTIALQNKIILNKRESLFDTY